MKKDKIDILSSPVRDVLHKMTTPMIFGLLAIMLFQAVDTYFVGKLGTQALAAISFTFPITFIITSIVIGLSIGLSVLLAQSLGQGDHSKAEHITTDGLFLALLIVSVLCLICGLFLDEIFIAMGATENTLPLIKDYMIIWYSGVIFLAQPMIGNAAIRATGDTLWPSIIMMASGVINAILDPILIFGLGPIPAMGVKGAAYASVASWVGATLINIYLLRFRDRLLLFTLSNWHRLKSFWWALLKISLPLCAANVMTPIGGVILTTIAASFGEPAVAAIGSGSRIESLLMIVIFALSAILSPFIAQNIGAKKHKRAHEAVYLSLKFSILFQTGVYLLTVLLSYPLSRIYSNDPEVIYLTQAYLCIASGSMVFYSILIVMNTLFNSAKYSGLSLNTSTVRVFLGICCCLLGSAWYGYTGMLIGILVTNIGVALYAYALGRRFLQNQLPCFE